MIEQSITDALKSLVANRVFADAAPLNAAKPFIVFQQVGGRPFNYVSGVPTKRNGRFQIRCAAATRAESSRLSRQVEDIMRLDEIISATSIGGAIADYDGDTKIYSALQDFSVWFTD